MTDSAPGPKPPEPESLRLRHVLALVLAGIALGALFNALQRSADSARGLAWVKSERRVISLEALSRTPAATRTDTVRVPVADPTKVPSHSAPSSAPTPAVRSVRPSASPAAPAPVPVAPAPAAASTVVPASPAPTAGLPAIPDSRDPIEVGLDIVRPYHAAGAALFLDARSAEEYAQGHIAGAVNLPFDDVFQHPALAKAVEAKGRLLITYCGGGDCDLSRNLAFSLLDSGFRKVLVFKGGLPEWTSAGGSVNRGTQP